MLNRRRFLTIAAVAVATPALAQEQHEWTGTAMGSAARIQLAGCDANRARRIFHKVEAILQQVEGAFSLHRDSDLTRLNRIGRLSHPGPHFLDLCERTTAVHAATAGVFDPTIQPLWLATAQAGDVETAHKLIGWTRVRISAESIALEPGMQLTFNGIAQGHAADRVAALMRDEGFTDVLIDMGEAVGIGKRPDGGGWQAAIAMPDGTEIARTRLSNRALATSSPSGTLIGTGRPHILDPHGTPARWQLASVSAPRAMLADALSTAFCLMDRPAIDTALSVFPDARLEALV